jgi:AraC-like DNA-binding protein
MTVLAKKAPPLLRIGHLMAFTGYLRRRGAPADRYMRRSGLPVLCDDPNTYAPLSRMWSFFDTAARHEGPELGWRVGAHVGDHGLNAALLWKLETAPTLLQALSRFARLARSEATGTEIDIVERQDDILFYTRYLGMAEEPGYHVSQAYQLGVILDLIRHFLGRQWAPDEIGIESRYVPSGTEACFPGSRILTQQAAGYIAVSRSCLHRASPLGSSKSGRADGLLLNNHLRFTGENFDYLSLLRTMLRSYVSEGYISERVAAELMNTSVRTLTRRLSVYGLTYGTLIDDIRFRVAKERLRNPDVPVADVAQSVGFEYQGAFTRMFRRIGGLSPRQYRNSIQN